MGLKSTKHILGGTALRWNFQKQSPHCWWYIPLDPYDMELKNNLFLTVTQDLVGNFRGRPHFQTYPYSLVGTHNIAIFPVAP